MGIVIRGGTVACAEYLLPRGEVRIEGERVVTVGERLAQPGDRVLDAGGCIVLPGGIDPHTHIEMPAGDLRTVDDWFDGTAAALAGGTTCVIDMITQERGGSLAAALADWQQRAEARAAADYSFHMGIIDPRPEVLAELPAMVAAGIPSVKLYLAYKGRLMLDDGAAFRVMRAAGQLGARVLVHAENGEIIEVLMAEALARGERHAGVHGRVRPPAAEAEATERAIRLARMAGCSLYVVHVTCQGALAAVAAARRQGWAVHAEACAHHLVLTAAEYDRPGFAAAPYVLSPPLRSEADRQALWAGLGSGDIAVVATDHCPWNLQGQKDRGAEDFTCIPNGAPGIEERLALLYTHGVAGGRLSLQQFAALTSGHAARIFGLYPQKGTILPGSDADILVWDPEVRRTLSAGAQRSRADHSLYEGMPVTGAPRYVLLRGRLAVEEGRLRAEPGWGRFCPRSPAGAGDG